MRRASAAALLFAGLVSACSTFQPGPLSDVTPPGRISIQSPQPFEAQSTGAPPCRVTSLTGAYSEIFNDTLYVSRVDAFVAAPDQATPCTLRGSTGVATAELRGGAQVLTEQVNGDVVVFGTVLVILSPVIALLIWLGG